MTEHRRGFPEISLDLSEVQRQRALVEAAYRHDLNELQKKQDTLLDELVKHMSG